MTIVDSVFGEMTYDYGWTKKDSISFLEKDYLICCVASAYKQQDILEVQREAYLDYIKNKSTYEIEIDKLINKHFASFIDETHIKNSITPKEIVFDREGKFAVLCDCSWDEEKGIAIVLSPYMKVVSQNEFL